MDSQQLNTGAFASRSRRIVDTKVFDAEYYSAEAGQFFESDMAAAEHFVQFGMKSGLSIHPLFDLGYFPQAFRARYQAGDVDYVLAYLKSEKSRTHLWSNLFDPSQITDAKSDGSRLLARFRSSTDPSLPLPENFVGFAPTWKEARDVLINHARTARSYEMAKKPLRHRTWSQETEANWIARIGASALTSAEGIPVASIIMPVWNREMAVRTAIDSVRNQTLTDWELVVVDDGSTDNTREVVRAYSLIDPRIRLIEADHQGVCAARNKGIADASGEYVAFLDSDNTWRPDFLRLMVSGLRSGSARAAYSAVRMLNERQEYMGQPVDSKQLLLRNYVDLNVLVAETGLIRQIGGFDEALRRWVDYDLVLRIVVESPISYFPFIGCDYVDDDNDDRITRTESINWQFAVIGKNIGNWLKPDISSTLSHKPNLSVVVRASGNISRAVKNIRCLVESNNVKPWDIVLIDEVDELRHSIRLRAAVTGLAGIRYIKLPRRYTDAIAFNVGAAHSEGSNILFLKDGVEVRADSVEKMLAQFDHAAVLAVQPLITDPAGIVLSAGAVACSKGPAVPLFRGLTIADAQRHSGRDLDELSPAAFLVRAATFASMGGLSAIFEGDSAVTHFFRRVIAASPGSLRTEAHAIAVDHADDSWSEPLPLKQSDLEWVAESIEPRRSLDAHYREIGLHVARVATPRLSRLQPAVPLILRQPLPAANESVALRWAIKICADFTAGGDRWGDVPYAADLAEALSARGQDVVIDRAQAFTRRSNYLDDVVLVIRGLHPCEPQPGKTNILWAISRPDQITKAELQGFDIVYGASRIWCEYVRAEWGINARYLPQATNARRFHPAPRPDEVGPRYDLTFVGGARDPRGRKVVADCVEAGYLVNVWGPRWERFVPADMIVSEFIDNNRLVEIYSSSRIVLNDHFDDMANWGFANNRLYDAVASGAKVISDEVDGVMEIFKGAVQTYRNSDELIALLSDSSLFPNDEEVAEISDEVRKYQSFDRRAEVILQDVINYRKNES